MQLEVANLMPVDPADERERLIRHICESVRVYTPAQKIDEFFRMKQRLRKTPIQVLRQILEEGVVNLTAAQFIRGAR